MRDYCLLSLSSLLLGGGGDLKNNHNETLQFSYVINLDILPGTCVLLLLGAGCEQWMEYPSASR